MLPSPTPSRKRRLTAAAVLGVVGLIAGLTSAPAYANVDDAPIRVADGLIDLADTNTLGLPQSEGAETITIFAPGDDDLKFNHGVVLMPFKGKLYAQWQTSEWDEDTPDTVVTYSVSSDGDDWSAPVHMTQPREDGYTSNGGWWTDGETLIAYLNVWPASTSPRGGYAEYISSTDGVNWTEPQRVTGADGQPINGIIEQDVKALPGGRILTAFHVQPGLHVKPFYTDDPLGVTGWTQGEFENQPNTDDMSRELEPSWFQQPDGSVVMVFRDQGNTFYKLAAISEDEGETWSESVLTNIPDSRTKQSAGNLPDGTSYLVGNPTGNNQRIPLSILLSADGETFDTGYTLRDADDLQPRRYQGVVNRKPSYSYPKSIVWDDHLYMSYGTNKEDAQLTRVPVSEISLRDVPGEITTLRAIGQNRSLSAIWTPPAQQGDAAITGYVITAEATSGRTATVEADADDTRATLTELHPGRYRITVTAVNQYGAGEESDYSAWVNVNGRR
ncbi:exo-alpha-sialidase [Microbacterium sp. A82]|uniref:exo-alpha-sialidase n=1 Tax=unclassified Microbacterium TaxID=2609290 RepID=UPI003F3F823F